MPSDPENALQTALRLSTVPLILHMRITRTIQLSPQALNILDAIASELELHDLSEAVEYCILKQKLNEKELAHALLARLSSGSLRPVDDENS